MKKLQTLIKIHKHQLDIIIRDISLHEQKIKKINQDLDLLSTQINFERNQYGNNIEYTFILDAYLKRAQEEKCQHSKEINILQEKINILKEAVWDKFCELKKFQIILERRVKLNNHLDNIKENFLLDELNIISYKIISNFLYHRL